MTILDGSVGSIAIEGSLAASLTILSPIESTLTWTLVNLPWVTIAAGEDVLRLSMAGEPGRSSGNSRGK